MSWDCQSAEYTMKLNNSDLPQEKRRSQERTYICDFSRCGLNTRLYTLVSKPCSEATNIGSFISCELSLAAEVKSEFMF